MGRQACSASGWVSPEVRAFSGQSSVAQTAGSRSPRPRCAPRPARCPPARRPLCSSPSPSCYRPQSYLWAQGTRSHPSPPPPPQDRAWGLGRMHTSRRHSCSLPGGTFRKNLPWTKLSGWKRAPTRLDRMLSMVPPLGGPRRVGGLLGVAGRLSGTVSPFRAEQGTSLETPWRPRASSCQEVGTTLFFSSCGGFSSYDGDLSLRLGLALGSPIFPSGDGAASWQ